MTDSWNLPPGNNPPEPPEGTFIPDSLEALFPFDSDLDDEPLSGEFIKVTYEAALKGLVSETFLAEQEAFPPEERDPLYGALDQISYAHILCREVVRDQTDESVLEGFNTSGIVAPHMEADLREFKELIPEVVGMIHDYEDMSVRDRLLELLREGMNLGALPEDLQTEINTAFQNPDIAIAVARLSAEADAAEELLKSELEAIVTDILRDHSGDHDDIQAHAAEIVKLAMVKRLAFLRGISLPESFENITSPDAPRMSDLRERYSSELIDSLYYGVDTIMARRGHDRPDDLSS